MSYYLTEDAAEELVRLVLAYKGKTTGKITVQRVGDPALDTGTSKVPGDMWGEALVKIWNMRIPEGITEIGAQTFNGLPRLHFASFPKSLRKIGSYAFGGCYSLEEISLNDGLEQIGSGAFTDTAIKSVEIPGTVKSVAGFSTCTKLEHAVIREGAVEIAEGAFHGSERLGAIDIPLSVKKIAPYAFAHTGLNLVNFGGTEEISENAFTNCDRLFSLDLTPSVKKIGRGAFSDSPLSRIKIPPTVRTIGEFAFYNADDDVKIAGGAKFKLASYGELLGDGEDGYTLVGSRTFPSAVMKKLGLE